MLVVLGSICRQTALYGMFLSEFCEEMFSKNASSVLRKLGIKHNFRVEINHSSRTTLSLDFPVKSILSTATRSDSIVKSRSYGPNILDTRVGLGQGFVWRRTTHGGLGIPPWGSSGLGGLPQPDDHAGVKAYEWQRSHIKNDFYPVFYELYSMFTWRPLLSPTSIYQCRPSLNNSLSRSDEAVGFMSYMTYTHVHCDCHKQWIFTWIAIQVIQQSMTINTETSYDI